MVLVAQTAKHIAKEPPHGVYSSIELDLEAHGSGVQDLLIPGDIGQGGTQICDHSIQLHQLGLLCPIGMKRREVRHVGCTELVHIVGKRLPLSCVLQKRGEVTWESG